MAEFFSIPIQTVAQGQNVLFTDTVSPCKKSCFIMHREDSGIVTLRAPQILVETLQLRQVEQLVLSL